MDVVQVLGMLGGVASRAAILTAGVTGWQLGEACHAGAVIRVRRGWYALPGAERDIVAAVRVGGMLTCANLLGQAGVWSPPVAAGVHVSVARNASRLRSARSRTLTRAQAPEGVVLHWRPRNGATKLASDSIAGALAALATCTDAEGFVGALDSAIRHGGLRARDLQRLPKHLVALADPRCESGGESAVRLRLRALGIAFRMQVEILGVGRVDFVIGERVVVEVDGFEVHGTREGFERDRRRDQELVARGYLVIRVTYRQLSEDWDRVARAILAIVRSDRHRVPPAAA